MKVIFIDKQTDKLYEIPNVSNLKRQHNGKFFEWLCEKGNGYTEHYKCSRFELAEVEVKNY